MALAIGGLALDFALAAGGTQRVLAIDEFAIAPGEAIGITGPSGSGKSSLVYCLAGILRPVAGSVTWDGMDIARLAEDARDSWRRRNVGLVFQDFHLIDGMNAAENVLLPFRFRGFRLPSAARTRAFATLAGLGVDALKRVELLSRGEKQRVALARALAAQPRAVLADEPTASLDAVNGAAVGDLLVGHCRSSGASLLVVSHDRHLLDRLDRIYRLAHGSLTLEPPP